MHYHTQRYTTHSTYVAPTWHALFSSGIHIVTLFAALSLMQRLSLRMERDGRNRQGPHSKPTEVTIMRSHQKAPTEQQQQGASSTIERVQTSNRFVLSRHVAAECELTHVSDREAGV